jgi:hypothetical protein
VRHARVASPFIQTGAGTRVGVAVWALAGGRLASGLYGSCRAELATTGHTGY